MKKSIITAFTLAALVLVSCKKENIEPDIQDKAQTVTYSVECVYCLVYVEDNIWNKSKDRPSSKYQYFNVNGKWQYDFVNKDLDSVEMKISVSAFSSEQDVKASITTSDGKEVSFAEKMGFNENISEEPYPYEKSLTLKLK